jgi:hypothetical protein
MWAEAEDGVDGMGSVWDDILLIKNVTGGKNSKIYK